MEKTILIGNKKVTLKATAGAVVRYKQQFGTDYSKDIFKLKDMEKSKEEYVIESLNIGYRLIWSMAKTADKSISSPEVWITEFENFDLKTALEEANALFIKSIEGVEGSEGDETATAETIIAVALNCGLDTEDIDNLSLSVLMNTIGEYCRIRNGEQGVKKATQADFDNFKKR